MEISASNSTSKKRKINYSEEDEEKPEEEAKMETFFALVRSMRETRDRWISFRSGDNKNKMSNNVTAAGKEENKVDVWKPTFQLEDFAEEEAQCRNRNPMCESNNCPNKKDDAEKGIDLRLSL